MAMSRFGHGTARSRITAGFTFVELATALFILTVGLSACIGLVLVAVGSNGRNRQDSNSITMARMVIQQFLSVSADNSWPAASGNWPPTLTITDCAGNSQLINTTGSAGGSGAALLSSGGVDYSQPAPTNNYSMLYQDCATTGTTVYDIRWNVKTLSTYTKLVTVSAAPSLTSTTGGPYFALPVTICTIAGRRP
jgi:Tfp pilus assembly protein PilV